MPRLGLVHEAAASDDDLYHFFATTPALTFRHDGDVYQAPLLADAVASETVRSYFEAYNTYLTGRGGLRQLLAVGGVAAEDVASVRGTFGLGADDVWEIAGPPPAAARELSRDWISSEYVVIAPYLASPAIRDVESAANASSLASYLNAPLFYASPSSGLAAETLQFIKYLSPRRAVIVEIGDVLPASVEGSLRAAGIAITADLTSRRQVVTYINDLTEPAPPVLCCFRGRDMAAPAAVAAARYGGFVLEVPPSLTTLSNEVGELVAREAPQGPEKRFDEFYVMPAAVTDGEQQVADEFYAWLEGLGGTDPGQLEYVLTFASAFGEDSLSLVFDRAIIGNPEAASEAGAAPGRFLNPPAESLASFDLTSAYRALIFANPRPARATFCGLVYMAHNAVTCPDFFEDNYGRRHKVNEVLGCRAGGYDDPGVFDDFRAAGYDVVVHNGRREGSGRHPLVPGEDLVGFPLDLYRGSGFFYCSTHGTKNGFYPFDADRGVAANVEWGQRDWPGGPSGYVNYDGDSNFNYNRWAEMGNNSFGLVAAFNACSIAGGEMNAVVMRRLASASLSSYVAVNAPASGWFWISFVNRMLHRGYTLGEALGFATAQVSEIFPARRGGVDSTIRFVLVGDPLMAYYRPKWQPPTPANVGADYGGHHPGGGGPLARKLEARPGEARVTVAWRAPAGRPMAGWNLFRAETEEASASPTGGGTSPVKINGEAIRGASPFAYVDASLVNGKRYRYWLEAVEENGRTRWHGPRLAVPQADYGKAAFALAQNYPNPVREETAIVFVVPENTYARLVVYDLRGAVVRRLWEGPAAAGGHKVSWDGAAEDGTPLPAGVYLYRLEAAGRTATRKMVRAE